MMGILIRYSKGSESSDSFQNVVQKQLLIYVSSLLLPSRTRAHNRDFVLFAFTTFTELEVNIWQLVI